MQGCVPFPSRFLFVPIRLAQSATLLKEAGYKKVNPSNWHCSCLDMTVIGWAIAPQVLIPIPWSLSTSTVGRGEGKFNLRWMRDITLVFSRPMVEGGLLMRLLLIPNSGAQ